MTTGSSLSRSETRTLLAVNNSQRPRTMLSGSEPSSLLWRAAVHEAGHAIADHHNGFCPIEVTIDPEFHKPGEGKTICRDMQATPATAERYVVSCMAGSEAERAFVADDEWTNGGATSDLAKASSVLTACAHEVSFYTLESRRLVLDNERAIRHLAKTLMNTKRLVGRSLQLEIDADLGVPGIEERLRTFRDGGETWDLGICRWYGAPAQLRPQFLTDVLFDALLEVDRSDADTISTRPQRDDDLERMSALAERSELMVEFFDDVRDTIYLRRATVVDRVAHLVLFSSDY